MEFRFNKETRVGLADGVDANKFGALRAITIVPEEVKKVFLSYGYNLDVVPGIFLKMFCLNVQELKELENNLAKIETMGMRSVFQANFIPKYFKNSFMSKLEKCIAAGLPYLNSDNTFASFFDNEEKFAEYLASAEIKRMNNPTQTDMINAQIEYESHQEVPKPYESHQEANAPVVQMTPEDKQVYNEIVKNLNYLVLDNPLDTMLDNVVKNAVKKVVDAILRQEYKFLGVGEMVESVMFDGLDVTPADNERITNLVLGAFPNEERTVG